MPFESILDKHNLKSKLMNFKKDKAKKELNKQLSPEIKSLIDQYPEYKDIILKNIENSQKGIKAGEIINDIRSGSPSSASSSPIGARPTFKSQAESSGNGSCFIATEVYGSPFQEKVIILKQIRDEYLLNYLIGRKFITTYYKYSPSFSIYLSGRPIQKKIIRIILNPIVGFSKWILNHKSY